MGNSVSRSSDYDSDPLALPHASVLDATLNMKTKTIDLTQLMKELKATKVVRVTGSFADGSQTENSDIDFRINESKQDLYGKDVLPRPIDKVKEICDKHGIVLGSSFIGSFHTHNQSGNGYLPISLEFSEYFKPRKGRMKEVELYGAKFKTY